MGVASFCIPEEVWLRANSLMDASMFRTPVTMFCFKLAPILPRFSYNSTDKNEHDLNYNIKFAKISTQQIIRTYTNNKADTHQGEIVFVLCGAA